MCHTTDSTLSPAGKYFDVPFRHVRTTNDFFACDTVVVGHHLEQAILAEQTCFASTKDDFRLLMPIAVPLAGETFSRSSVGRDPFAHGNLSFDSPGSSSTDDEFIAQRKRKRE